ncbi:MAG: protein translocase subunit SecDF [Cytophagaceae bacterium]|jgi:SecD/SecF fusion protein|nr:protein translocase subunit SecDF [Cytophagaceae bacterium]
MQNKGAIRLFAILLALVCLYQLSFTFVTRKVEKQADEYAVVRAAGNSESVAGFRSVYLDSISAEPVYNFLFMRKYTYMECKNREINFGLDLKGGMNLILEIKVADIVRALSNYNQDEKFLEAMRLAEQREKSSTGDFISLFYDAFREVAPDGNLSAIFATVDLRDKVKPGNADEDVLTVLREESQSAIDNAFNIISTRIDRFGVTQPNVQRLQKAGQILIELPGITEPERVRNLLQGTASLEFWETYDNQEIYDGIMNANNVVIRLEESKKAAEQLSQETTLAETPSVIEDGLLTGLEEDSASVSDDGLNLLGELEGDSTQVAETEGISLFTYMRPSQYPTGPAVGLVAGRDTAKVNYYFSLDQVRSALPRDLRLMWSVKAVSKRDLERWMVAPNSKETYYELVAIKLTHDGRAPLEGDAVSNARMTTNNQNTFEISMSMTGEGSKTWARLTKANMPGSSRSITLQDGSRPGKSIAIVLDGYVYSFPTVQNEISGGQSSITGNFTPAEATDLANILKSGKLPAPARIVEDTVVGPSLGKEAVNAGLRSFIWAFLAVLIYMILYYGFKAGVVSDLALILNMFFILGVMAAFGAVLTLPGIAGIVLTLGMAVDANVLIYERIKEELAGGKGLKLAVNEGYKNAFSAIIDANVTTFLTGLILFLVGTGPIKGFATTLMIGIVTSFFTAVFVSRLIFISLLKREVEIDFSTAITKNLFKNMKAKFLENRQKLFIISGVLSAVAIVSLCTLKLKPGIDFTGGRTYVVRFAENVNAVEVQSALSDVFSGANVEAKTFGSSNQIRLATNYMFADIQNEESDGIVEDALYNGLKTFLDSDVTKEQFIADNLMSSQKVGPTIATKTTANAFIAVALSLLVIFLYIFIRFRQWQFGLGAVVALAHDVLMVLGIYSLTYSIMPFAMEVDQSFIAAILTVVGYSINDTVVVFDRIREYKQLYPKRRLQDVINMALNASVARTINTSVTTFLVLLVIFIFGSEVIRGFIFALMIGIVVGTYSTFFIATPITFNLLKRKEDPEVEKVVKAKK